MNDVCEPNERKGTGNIVIGATLIMTGVAITLDRAGVFHWRDHWTLWPIILGGIGLARFLQSVPGQPKQGLLFLTAAIWLFLGDAGLVSLESSWPIVVIVLGVIVALNGGVRRRRWHGPDQPGTPGGRARYRHMRPDYPMSPLAVLGIWIAIVIGLQTSGIRSFNDANSDNRVHVVSVMGRAEHTSRATAFEGATVTNIMGRSELDLRAATLTPGANANMQLFSAMGSVVVRVPRTWIVDAGAVTAVGGVRDDRDPSAESEVAAGPAPRLVLRGLVLFGRLTITS